MFSVKFSTTSEGKLIHKDRYELTDSFVDELVLPSQNSQSQSCLEEEEKGTSLSFEKVKADFQLFIRELSTNEYAGKLSTQAEKNKFIADMILDVAAFMNESTAKIRFPKHSASIIIEALAYAWFLGNKEAKAIHTQFRQADAFLYYKVQEKKIPLTPKLKIQIPNYSVFITRCVSVSAAERTDKDRAALRELDLYFSQAYETKLNQKLAAAKNNPIIFLQNYLLSNGETIEKKFIMKAELLDAFKANLVSTANMLLNKPIAKLGR